MYIFNIVIVNCWIMRAAGLSVYRLTLPSLNKVDAYIKQVANGAKDSKKVQERQSSGWTCPQGCYYLQFNRQPSWRLEGYHSHASQTQVKTVSCCGLSLIFLIIVGKLSFSKSIPISYRRKLIYGSSLFMAGVW